MKNSTTKNTVIFYFESRKGANSDVEKIEFDEKNNVYLITFEESEAVERVLSKSHTVHGARLDVKRHITPKEVSDDHQPISTGIYFCNICQGEDVISPGSIWCLECEEWLCDGCGRHHGRSNLSKHHKIITVQQYDSLPQSVLQISKTCNDHNEKFERFCLFHNAPCCIQCISETHRDCKLQALCEIVEYVKDSPAMSNLEKDLQEMENSYEAVESHLNSREKDVEIVTQLFFERIKKVRKSFDDHLNAIEGKFTEEVLAESQNVNSNLKKLILEVEERKKKVLAINNDLINIKQYANDFQIFRVIREMETQAAEEVNYLQGLHKRSDMMETRLKVEISSLLESPKENITWFGKVMTESHPSTLMLRVGRQDEAQLPISTTPSPDQIKLTKLLSINLPDGFFPVKITGCLELPDGRFTFVDSNNNRLMLCNTKGIHIKDIYVCQPYNLFYAKDVRIAVLSEGKVAIIDTLKAKEVGEISVQNVDTGFCCDGERIFVQSQGESTVRIASLEGLVTGRFTTLKIVSNMAMDVFEEQIYYCDGSENTISCYDMKGQLIWKYKLTTDISPSKISVGKNGFVYAICRKSNTVLVVSPKGGNSKVLIRSQDGVQSPSGVYVSKTQDHLLVSNENDGQAFLFLIS